MFDQATAVVAGLRTLMAELEPRCLSGDDAARLLGSFAEAERLAGVGKALMARRMEETSLHCRDGHRSAAELVASATGTSVGAAGRELETARRMEKLGPAGEAWRKGKLSAGQAAEIASAATADPSAEAGLLALAATKPLAELAERCRRVRAAADEAAGHEALHRSRYLRHWRGDDGAFRMDVRTTPEAGAAIVAGLAPFTEAAFAEARAAGRRAKPEAYAADALVAMARAAAVGESGGAPAATVQVRVDAAALTRGYVQGDETCEIPGIGPVPVAAARAVLGDAVVKLVLTKGVDAVSVVHLGRTVTAHQRSALELRDPTCVVEGCSVRQHLEIDHLDGWALTKVTTLDRLARLCRWHHHLKTYEGYRLQGRPGHWRWCGPEPSEEAGPAPPGELFAS
jgi:hypothetical protein